jgi:hypothetical protein
MSLVIKRLYVKPGPAKFGGCCNCGSEENVWTVTMIARRGPTNPGWGCAACGLDPQGALAALCDRCAFDEPLKVWVGAAMYGERAPVSDLSPDEFNHKPDCPYRDSQMLGRFGPFPVLTDRSKGLPS